jgi:hypothetical protein
MLYRCTKKYDGKFKGIKGHTYALSEKSIEELQINKLNNFKLLTEDEERDYIEAENLKNN